MIPLFQSTRPIRGATLSRNPTRTRRTYFNPRAEEDERRSREVFQSTRPIRGATRASPVAPGNGGNFNPRAPYGARLLITGTVIQAIARFQSTRPIRGATHGQYHRYVTTWSFQSTRPIRGATSGVFLACLIDFAISIHAPHTGRDFSASVTWFGQRIFQSTRPIRGATYFSALSR